LLFIFSQRLSHPMLDVHACAGALEKDVGHVVFVDLYESSILISRKTARLRMRRPDDTLLAGRPACDVAGFGSMGMPPQAWSRFLPALDVPAEKRPPAP
jgi:hypothetical protein